MTTKSVGDLEHADDETLRREMGDVFMLHKHLGKFEEAEARYRHMLEAMERSRAPEDPIRLNCMGNYAGLLREKGDIEAAQSLYRGVLETIDRIYGKNPDPRLQGLQETARDGLADIHEREATENKNDAETPGTQNPWDQDWL